MSPKVTSNGGKVSPGDLKSVVGVSLGVISDRSSPSFGSLCFDFSSYSSAPRGRF